MLSIIDCEVDPGTLTHPIHRNRKWKNEHRDGKYLPECLEIWAVVGKATCRKREQTKNNIFKWQVNHVFISIPLSEMSKQCPSLDPYFLLNDPSWLLWTQTCPPNFFSPARSSSYMTAKKWANDTEGQKPERFSFFARTWQQVTCFHWLGLGLVCVLSSLALKGPEMTGVSLKCRKFPPAAFVYSLF